MRSPITSVMVDGKCKVTDSNVSEESSCESIELGVLSTAGLLPHKLWHNIWNVKAAHTPQCFLPVSTAFLNSAWIIFIFAEIQSLVMLSFTLVPFGNLSTSAYSILYQPLKICYFFELVSCIFPIYPLIFFLTFKISRIP